MRNISGLSSNGIRSSFLGSNRGGVDLASYSLGTYAPTLVLDFTRQIYAADPSGWAEPYAVGGERPTMLLDFIREEYGA